MGNAETIIKSRSSEILPPGQLLTSALSSSDPRRQMDDSQLLEANRIAYPVVAAPSSRKEGAGLALGGGFALLLGAATFFGLSGGRDAAKRPAAAPVGQDHAPAQALAPQPVGLPAPPSQTVAPPGSSLVFSSTPRPLQLGPVPLPAGQGAAGAPSPLSQRFRSPTLLVDTSGPLASAVPGVAGPVGSPASNATAAGGDEFTARADASATDTASAMPLAEPGHTVVQGTLIPAVLETAINSDLPGYVRALVSQDVRSFDGKRVLIPRSSRLIGQYRSGLAAGQTRTYVLWSRLIRPDGASVALASPATDESGTAGLTGEVQSHFFKRFGSALLLSVVGAAGAIGTGGTSLLVGGGGSAAAGAAAQQNGSIPPTVRVRQGQPIRVFTARDLDFSTVRSAGQS